MTSKHTLSWQQRADFFSQLAALEKAGLPSDQALSAIKLPTQFTAQLAIMRKALKRGKTLAQAGQQAHLFTSLDAALIAASCMAGSPASTYQRLAEQATLNARLNKQIRSRLAQSALILLISLLVNPLPEFVAGSISIVAYFLHVITPLLGIGAIIYTAKWLINTWEQSSTPPNILLNMPFFGDWYVRRNRRDFIANLSLLLKAGISMHEALPIAQNTIANTYLRAQIKLVLRQIQRGESLTLALPAAHWLNETTLIAMVNTGEVSGTLDEMLARVSAQLDDDLTHTATQFAAWLPRLVYTALALWMAWGLIDSSAFSPPHLPADL